MINLIHELRMEINGLFEISGPQTRPPFLHRAESDDFLLCSDAPRRLLKPACTADLIQKAGLHLTEKDSLWFLDARADDYSRLDASLPATMPENPPDESYIHVWALSRMLSEHICNAACQPLWAVRRTLKALEAGCAQIHSLSLSLPPQLSVLLRKKEPLPSLAGKLLAQWLNEKEK